MGYVERLTRKLQSRSMRYGVPFLIFVLGGSFGLREFTALRYKYGATTTPVHEKAGRLGLEMKKPGEVTLESEYEKVKNMDIDNWENKRGPRPWEQDSENK